MTRVVNFMATLLVLGSFVFVLQGPELILELIDQRPHFLDTAGPCPLSPTVDFRSCVPAAVHFRRAIDCQGVGPHVVFELPSSLSVNPAIVHVTPCPSACRAIGRFDICSGRILASIRWSGIRFVDIGLGNYWLSRRPASFQQLP